MNTPAVDRRWVTRNAMNASGIAGALPEATVYGITLTITPAGPAPAETTHHPDRAAATAALGDYISATDCEPIVNQITVDYASYDLICMAQQRVAATATVERTPGPAPTDRSWRDNRHHGRRKPHRQTWSSK